MPSTERCPWSCSPLLTALLALACATMAPGCTGDDTDGTSAASTVANTSATSAADTTGATSGNPDTGTAGASETGTEVDCDDATDQPSCAAATNTAEGGGCSWMVIQALTIDDAGACSFTDTGTGRCVGTDGVDDGCNEGLICRGGDEVYYRDVPGGGFEMAQGTACRGINQFMQCTDMADPPCTCACEIP